MIGVCRDRSGCARSCSASRATFPPSRGSSTITASSAGCPSAASRMPAWPTRATSPATSAGSARPATRTSSCSSTGSWRSKPVSSQHCAGEILPKLYTLRTPARAGAGKFSPNCTLCALWRLRRGSVRGGGLALDHLELGLDPFEHRLQLRLRDGFGQSVLGQDDLALDQVEER